MTPTRDIGRAIRGELKKDRALGEAVERHGFAAEIASLIYDARQDAGLTQQELADLVGTQQSVIARLEDWDYSGHSLTMLKRIGDALGKTLHVEFRPCVSRPNEKSKAKAARNSTPGSPAKRATATKRKR